jgi:ubiquinone/menaquinone biosynthesis C-methylase UbiE
MNGTAPDGGLATSLEPTLHASMPYVDQILADFDRNDDTARTIFARDMHWGYWSAPEKADGSPSDQAAAAERMTSLMCESARIADGMRVLDCGCGFGGTLAYLNEHHSGMKLVGLNIDERQLSAARERLVAQHDNQISFVKADACRLPFDRDSFDAVLAVQSIFHFPSRLRFLSEAARVLTVGGWLGVSDFVPQTIAVPILLPLALERTVSFFGERNPIPMTMPGYRILARRAGLRLRERRDVTQNTLPSYRVIRQYFANKALKHAVRQASMLERINRLGLVRYEVLSLEKATALRG